MLNIADKVDNTPGASGELTASEYNDHKNELQESITNTQQSLSNLKTPNQLSRSMFIYGTSAQTMIDSAPGANVIELTPLTGASGLKTPDAYAQMDGLIVEFDKATANTSTTVTVNFGQTTGTLLGAKSLVTASGNNPAIGSIVDRTRIQFDVVNDRWFILSTGSANLSVVQKTSNFTITNDEITSIYLMQPNTVSQYGTLIGTLPVGSSNQNKKFAFTHSSNKGLCQVVMQGGEVIRYKNQDLTYFNLYQEGDKIVLFWSASASKWFVYDCDVTYQTGFINRNAWSNTYFGSAQIDYNTKSATVDLTGMVIQESVSSNTWVVASDSAPGASSGTLYCYLATGTGFATNANTLTASDGTTCIVNVAGSTKNQNVNISHYSGISFEHARFYQLFTATPGTEASYRQLGPQWSNSSNQYNYGYSPVDLNFYRTVLTGGFGFAYADPGGSPVGIVTITGEFYYNIYVHYTV